MTENTNCGNFQQDGNLLCWTDDDEDVDVDDEDVNLIKGRVGTHGLSGQKHFSRVDTGADIAVCKTFSGKPAKMLISNPAGKKLTAQKRQLCQEICDALKVRRTYF